MPLIWAIALGILLNPLNSSMISVALARLQVQFDLSFVDASWLISTYYLTSSIGQPIMGKLSDTFNRKYLFLIGLTFVAVSCLLAPFSPNFESLVAIRMIQAVGSSMLYPAGMATVRKQITKNQARMFAILNMFSSISAAFGPTIGGLVIGAADWEAIFWINFPIIILSFILTLKFFPSNTVEKRKTSLDYAGVVLFSLTLISLLFFLLSLEMKPNWVSLGLFILVGIAFYTYEAKRLDPFIDVKSFRSNRNASIVYLQYILVNILFYSLFFGVPSYLQQVMHYSASFTGIMMLSVAGFGVIVSPIAGKWIDQTGTSKPALIAGSFTAIIGTGLLMTFHEATSPVYIFFVLCILGCTNGFNNLGLQTALYTFVKREETGIASGLFMTSRYIGTIFSSSLLGLFFADRVSLAGFHLVAVSGLIIGCLILILTSRLPGKVREGSPG
ncbi:MFS transporter [Bacillus sp. V5-8f]|uniref:MFS transporter n=1 Tax=Bacillus sp. V5-8f TaxID=2053044 RepID=UPI000C7636B8|nr:MFS transporter [Bacillus sp. V5-8f]PLT32870.1 MFS transporter [Bacillus sp. V5-8f]